MKVKYKDLSWPIKVAFVVAWFDLIVFSLGFIDGFFGAL